MRQVVLDTETTGLEYSEGHRIIEIGCVELVNRRRTQRVYHQYLNPERDIDAGARDVHGITDRDLLDKPRFAEVVSDFVNFVKDAQLVIHNAPFDIGFLNAELRRVGGAFGPLEDQCSVFDTLVLARQMHPGQRNSLDALCRRYSVDNSQREYHGALLDATILADVYLAMTGGQADLMLDEGAAARHMGMRHQPILRDRPALRTVAATPEERAAHEVRLHAIDRASGGRCIWLATQP